MSRTISAWMASALLAASAGTPVGPGVARCLHSPQCRLFSEADYVDVIEQDFQTRAEYIKPRSQLPAGILPESSDTLWILCDVWLPYAERYCLLIDVEHGYERYQYLPRASLTWLPSTDLVGLPVEDGGRSPRSPLEDGVAVQDIDLDRGVVHDQRAGGFITGRIGIDYPGWPPWSPFDEYSARLLHDSPRVWAQAMPSESALRQATHDHRRVSRMPAWPMIELRECRVKELDDIEWKTDRCGYYRVERATIPARFRGADTMVQQPHRWLDIQCQGEKCLIQLISGESTTVRSTRVRRAGLSWLPPDHLLSPSVALPEE